MDRAFVTPVPIPADNEVARICRPRTLDNGLPSALSFMPRLKDRDREAYLSCNWLQYFGSSISHEDALKKVRQTKKNYQFPRNGKFGILHIAATEARLWNEFGIELVVQHIEETDDPSHSGISGYDPDDSEEDLLEMARAISETVVDSYRIGQ